MKYIDIHTHNEKDEESTLQIVSYSVSQPDLQVNAFPSSIGLHPWDVNQNTMNELIEKVNQLAANQNCVAIGECGLDRIRKTNYDLQINAFAHQIEIAKFYAKPLIIHSVRSYYECKSMLKNMKFDLPVIFHAFNGNIDEKNALLALNSYFSFNIKLVAENRKIVDTFVDVPLDRIFFETDDSPIHISEIYKKASELNGVELNRLIEQIELNYFRIFK